MNLIPFLSYVFAVTFSPGPNNIMSMGNANQFGMRKTLPFLLGVFFGFFLVMIASNYLNLLLFNFIPNIKTYMAYIGASYMLYLAYKIIKSTYTKSEDSERLSTFGVGLMMQFVNPKGILYGLTVTATFILPYTQSPFLLVLFSLLLATFALVSTTSWAFFGLVFQRFLSDYGKPFSYVIGLFLVYSAISILGILS